jgi:hypothetical protein
MATFKPTTGTNPTPQGKKFESNFNKTMTQYDVNLKEVDNKLNEVEQSLKRKIFSLAKMEALVHSDPKLSSVYEEMAENGEEKYGYHYNETIQNMIFNDYVLNSPKYLQKYKQAQPMEKKRRDKSGINQLKKKGEEMQTRNLATKPEPKPVTEADEQQTKVLFLVNEKDPNDPDLFAYFPEENHDREGRYKTGYSHVGQHSAVDPSYAKESREATPEEYQDLKAELEGLGYNLDVLNGANNTIGESGEMLAQYVQNAFTNRQGNTPINFIINYLKSKYEMSREKIKILMDNIDDINAFFNMNPNPDKLKNYADKIYQEIGNSTNETSGSGGAGGGGGAFSSGSGQYSGPLGMKKQIEENGEDYEVVNRPDTLDAEADCVIESNGWKYSLSCGGVFEGEFNDVEQALARVKEWKKENHYYPNTWFISDHGNESLIDDEGNIINEATGSASSGAYYGPAMWGSGDLMHVKGKSKVKTVPMVKGGTIIGENYLVDPKAFEKYVEVLNEADISYQTELGKEYQQSHTGSNRGLGVSEIPQNAERAQLKKGIDDNTALFIGQDVDRMRDEDIKILHNDMTKNNTMFPHPDNPNLPNDGISGVDKAKKDNTIIDKTSAFTSDTVKGWNQSDTNTEMNTLQTGDPDKANLSSMEENLNEFLGGDALIGSDVVDIQPRAGEKPFILADSKWEFETATYDSGKKDIVVYSYKDDMYYDYLKWREAMGINEGNMNESLFSSALQGFSPMGFIINYLRKNHPDLFSRESERDILDANEDIVGTVLRNASPRKLIAYAEGIYKSRFNENTQTMNEVKKIEEKAKSVEQQRLFGMAHAVQKGELSPNKVGGAVKKIAKDVSPKDVEDFASTKHKGLPEKVSEDAQTIIADKPDSMSNKATPTSQQSSNVDQGVKSAGGGGMSESYESLLEEINKELDAFSIHHDKLKRMAEDRKPSALVLRDRVGSENEKNFKSDLKDSSVAKEVDIENALEWKDQQTDVGKDPQKLGADIEKTEIKATDAESGEALKDVGDSANDKGDEIPKRNMTEEEQDEVWMYRFGLGDLVYDNEVGKRFEDRMKKDMGEKLYKQRQEKLKFRGKAPMYNKDPQPIDQTTADKVQFDKEQTGWNEREGLKESIVSGKYFDDLGKKKIIDFNMTEVLELKSDKRVPELKKVNLEGLGNTYTQKVNVNESFVKAIGKFKFYTNGTDVFALKNPVQSLNEATLKTKPVVNEQMDKMKHLVGYNTAVFIKQNKI